MRDEIWDRYLDYLKEWVKGHDSKECKGMSPATFEDWLKCEPDFCDEE